MSYMHRNGETKAPTVLGQYWFDGVCLKRNIKDLIPVIHEGGQLLAWRQFPDGGWYEDIEQFAGQWWGPIYPPWESEVYHD